jgi:hypothetical protein
MFLENELSSILSLDGEWEFRLGDGPARALPVPSAWEAHLDDKLTDGPAIYRRTITIPESWLSTTVIALEADAISFHATVRVNGQEVGTHEGMWSPFQFDLTRFVHAGDNALEIEVWKPGPRFPPAESLAGFLPDVATTFGGLWQGIRLRVFSWAALGDVRVFAYGGGWLDVQGKIVGLGERRRYEIVVEILDADNQPIVDVRADVGDDRSFAAHIETGGIRNWSPQDGAALYRVRIAVRAREADIARVTRQVGFRDLEIRSGRIALNESYLHLRGVLDWGWDPGRICPTPSRADLLDRFVKVRALGFNLLKLCLFVPDAATFETADEMGMLLWLEMPMWQPNVTPALRELALREYRDLFRRLHHHPSIAVVSLGCELGAQVDPELLQALGSLLQEWFPNALHCDNSGSAEAYGGVPTTFSDFYDYHFYTDPHYFQQLVQHFHRPYQASKPWLYGEFCDADTLRDFSRLDPPPWWLTAPTALDRDPQRSDFHATRDHAARLRAAQVGDGGAALANIGRYQAVAVRKFVVELARTHSAAGGYVISGWVDTPITTSGVVDDRGEIKFSAAEWQQFNADRVLTIDRSRRRRYQAGVDQPLRLDPHVWWQGEPAELYISLSNGVDAIDDARLSWKLAALSGPDLASGSVVIDAPAGEVLQAAVVQARMPLSDGLVELRLTAALKDSTNARVLARNVWKLWAVPRVSPPGDSPPQAASGAGAALATALTGDVIQAVRSGAFVTVWLKSPDSRFTLELPFWREAIHVFDPHPLWDAVPHPGFADMRFLSVATGFAIDLARLADLLGPAARLKTLWRRFDARKMLWTEYVVEAGLGSGRLLLTSLRFEGGLGAQPDTLATNPMGAWLLQTLMKYQGAR